MQHLLLEFLIRQQKSFLVPDHGFQHLCGVGVGPRHAERGHIHPAFLDRVREELSHTDRLVLVPVDIDRILRVLQVSHEDAALFERVDIAGLIDLVFLRQLLVGCLPLADLRAEFAQDLLSVLFHRRMDGALGLARLVPRHVGQAHDVVAEDREVYLVDRNDQRGARRVLCDLHLADRTDLGEQDLGELLLEDVVCGHREVLVDRQIDVVSRLRAHFALDAEHSSEVVDVDRAGSLFPMKFGFEGGLDPGLADDIRRLIGRILLRQGLQLLRGDAARVAEDLGEVDAVGIAADRVLLDGDALERAAVLHDRDDRLLVHVERDRGGDVFLVAVEAEQPADGRKLQLL